MPVTENHIRQHHQTLLRHSAKDERHRGEYKKLLNHVVAIDEHGKEIGMVTIAEIVTHTGANQNTLKVRLRELVSAGRTKRHGKARAT